MFNANLSKIKNRCITELANIKIEDTKELVSLASDVMTILYYSIRRNGLRRDQILEDMEDQINEKYSKLISK